uniref:G-protein coupled receptors family 3 profile domain-containing protein n=1 Tax=Lepeophtheirus salmonis TaxID=72036 RepID=A0A0K2TH62_LEPSM
MKNVYFVSLVPWFLVLVCFCCFNNGEDVELGPQKRTTNPCKLVYLNKGQNESLTNGRDQYSLRYKGKIFKYKEKSLAVVCKEPIESLMPSLQCGHRSKKGFGFQCLNLKEERKCNDPMDNNMECKLIDKIRHHVDIFPNVKNGSSLRKAKKKSVLLMLPCNEHDPSLTHKWLKYYKASSSSTVNFKYFATLSCKARRYFMDNLSLLKDFDYVIQFSRKDEVTQNQFVNQTIRYCDRSSLNLENLQNLYETVVNVRDFTIFNTFSPHTIQAMNLLSKLAVKDMIRFKLKRRRLRAKDLYGDGVLHLGGTRTCSDDMDQDLSVEALMRMNQVNEIVTYRNCKSCWRFRFVSFPSTTTITKTATLYTSTTTIPTTTIEITTTTMTTTSMITTRPSTLRTTTVITLQPVPTISTTPQRILIPSSPNIYKQETYTTEMANPGCQSHQKRKQEPLFSWELLTIIISLLGITIIVFTIVSYLILMRRKRESFIEVINEEDTEIKIHEVFLPFGLLVLYLSNFVLIIVRDPDINCTLRRLFPGIGIAVSLTGVLSHILRDMKQNAYTVNTFESKVSRGGVIFLLGTCLIAIQILVQVLWIRLSPRGPCGGFCDYDVHRQFVVSFSYPIFLASLVMILSIVGLKRKVKIGAIWNMVALFGSLIGAVILGSANSFMDNNNATIILSQSVIAYSILTCIFLRKYLSKSKILWPQIQSDDNQIRHINTRKNTSRVNTISRNYTRDFSLYGAGNSTVRSNATNRSFGTIRSGGSFILPNIIAMPETTTWRDVWDYSERDRGLEELQEEEDEFSTSNSELSDRRTHYLDDEYTTENIYSEADDVR